jgi:translocation and assembly module TamB
MSAAGWAFLQSNAFGRLLSKAITEISVSKFDAKIRFSRINMRFYPPGLGLENVSLKYNRKGTSIEAEAGEIGVLFDINMFTNNKIRLGEIFLHEGFAVLEIPTEESDGKHPWDIIQDELQKLPVEIGSLSIKDSRLTLLDTTIDVHFLKLEPDQKIIKIDTELKMLQHKKMPSSIDILRIKAEVHRDSIQATHAQIIQKSSKVLGTGKILNWSEIDKLSFKGNIETEIYLPDAHEWGDLGLIRFNNGVLKAKGKFSWDARDGTKTEANFNLLDFESNIFTAKKLSGNFLTKENGLLVRDVSLINAEERIKVYGEVKVWEYGTRKILPNEISLSVENLELNNALSILGEPLKPLKGRLSGDMRVRIRGSDIYFYPKDGFEIENMRLEVESKNGGVNTIFNAPKIWLEKAELMLLNGSFVMKADVKAPKTQLGIEGYVNKDEVKFDVSKGNIRLEDLGNIADLDLKGEGENIFKVRGPLADVKLTLEGMFRDFEILGYRLGETNHKIVIGLKEGVVDIPSLKAKKGRYEYSGSGIVGYNKFLMDLSIDIPLINFSELKSAIDPLSSGLSFLPTDFEAMLQSSVEIYAKDSISNIRVGADVYGQKIIAGGESFKDAKFTFLYSDKQIKLKSFSATKEEGKINGELGYNLASNKFEYLLSLRNLSSTEISIYKRSPLALAFQTVGEFQGFQSPNTWRHKGFLGLSQSRVHDKAVPNSTFEWDVRDDSVVVDAKIAKDWILLSASSTRAKNITNVESDIAVNIPDLPLFMRGLLGENPQLANAHGEISLSSKLSINDWHWNKITARTWLKTLKLTTPEIKLDQRFDKPQVRINNGVVEEWNLQLNSPDLNLQSKAKGDFKKNLVIENSLDMDAKYLELLSRHLQRAQGRAKALLRWILTPNEVDMEFESSANELSISTDALPFTLSNLSYALDYKNNELDLLNLSFRPGDGKVMASGNILMSGINPDINLRYTLDRATFPFKSKSQVTVSGDGLIFGSRPPYLLSGDVTINSGSIQNELNDFLNNTTSSADTKYLPRDTDTALSGLLNLDLSLKTENPITLNNSMMDLSLIGNLQLSGDLLRLSADGKAQTASAQSKVFFKNSEYQINKAEFLFSSRKPITKPDFDVIASSSIANYKVTAKAFGNPESFTFDLSSDPALSKQNILSLIAFGYTDDLSNSISADERQNLTNVGVGSFIFDQFKVTDIVKKQFGLQVNLGTVFVQSDESMLQGRSSEQGGVGALARTRTATNIEVKKRLSEAMSLSVSSTVGGSIGQRQKMNLNYGLSKNVQLEGVYELRTNAEGTEDIIDNSIGGDVKFRMTFK